MPQSLVENFVHIVFSTKYRQPLRGDVQEHSLEGYAQNKVIAGLCLNFAIFMHSNKSNAYETF